MVSNSQMVQLYMHFCAFLNYFIWLVCYIQYFHVHVHVHVGCLEGVMVGKFATPFKLHIKETGEIYDVDV